MSGDDGNFVSRWSRRKIAARSGKPLETEVAPAPPLVPAQADTPEAGTPEEAQASVPLPPVESLTHESDFTPFMKADVDPGVKREALKVLMRDPRFNVMDGLDVYIDDYSKPDPMPPEWYGQLNMMKRLGSFLEEAEKPADEPSGELQKQMPEQAIEPEPESLSSGTENDNFANNGVTESGIAGGKLPRNEA